MAGAKAPVIGLLALGCGADPAAEIRRPPTSPDASTTPAPRDSAPPPVPDTGTRCAPDAVWTGSVCMDQYEAPNVLGETPLVMFTLLEAEAWCGARAKRLCFDDEWQSACEGTGFLAYPYGNTWEPGRCNDEETWRVYSQTDLNGWPAAASSTEVTRFDAQLAAADAVSPAASEEVAGLYQAEPAGGNPGCDAESGVGDLVGNVEEWTRRRDGGATDFHGALKGRYWAESRTCQSTVTTHGDTFQFYEIGFRCCAD